MAATELALGTIDSLTEEGGRHTAAVVTLPGRGTVHVALLARVGRGSFGVVYQARAAEHNGGADFAFKVASGKPDRLLAEMRVMAAVNRGAKGHPNIVQFHFGARNADDVGVAVMAMELCVPTTLHDLLRERALARPSDIIAVAHQVVASVAAVHYCDCIHRDVKLQNFVFARDGRLKLIDFGLAAESLTPPAGDAVAGTISFMAPEMARNALNPNNRVAVGVASDVWSVGITLLVIMTRNGAYPSDQGPEKQLELVANAAWAWPAGYVSPTKRLTDLVGAMLQPAAAKRPALSAVLKDVVWRKRSADVPLEIQNAVAVSDSDASAPNTPAVKPVAAPERSQSKKRSSARRSTTPPPPSPAKANPAPAPKVVAPAAPITAALALAQRRALARDEKDGRDGLRPLLLLELQERHAFMRDVAAAESQAWTDGIVWVAEQQLAYLKHPHKLRKRDLNAATGAAYDNGVCCDMCEAYLEALWKPEPGQPPNPELTYFHCSCGMDICAGCEVTYRRRLVCGECGAKHANAQLLAAHACGGKKRPREPTPVEQPPPKPATVLDGVLGSAAAVPQTRASVNAPLSTKWEPFAGSAWAATGGRRAPTALPATPDEARVMVDDDWVKYYRVLPDGGGVAYNVQPGRTGAILARGLEAHSGVVSMMERVLFVVASIDGRFGDDDTATFPLDDKALGEADRLLRHRRRTLLQNIAIADASMKSTRRCPGIMTVRHGPASAARSPPMRCFGGEPFVYLRWFKACPRTNMVLLLLSNGRAQVFAGEYELRWIDDERVFLVRSGNAPQPIDLVRFEHADALRSLMHEDIVAGMLDHPASEQAAW
jgi:serine/threonine protein kinase